MSTLTDPLDPDGAAAEASDSTVFGGIDQPTMRRL